MLVNTSSATRLFAITSDLLLCMSTSSWNENTLNYCIGFNNHFYKENVFLMKIAIFNAIKQLKKNCGNCDKLSQNKCLFFRQRYYQDHYVKVFVIISQMFFDVLVLSLAMDH